MRRITLVTGGSRGIGAATSALAAARGDTVVVNYARDALAAGQLARRIVASGGSALAVQADVSIDADVVRLFETIDHELGPLTGLVNNAGVVDVPARVDAMSAARIARMFSINVYGSFLCAREAIRRMSTKHGGAGGAIVNLSSAAARLGAPGQYVDYAAAKAAIDTFTIGLSKELAAEGVRVNAVRPGIIDTEIHASGGQPERARQLASQVPMQRPGSAAEVAIAIVWLLSDDASYCTGALLDVAGGR